MQQDNKIFTLGSITSLVFGVLVYPFLIYMYLMMRSDPLMTPYFTNFKYLATVIVFGSIVTGITVYKSSINIFPGRHFIRAILFGLGSTLGLYLYNNDLALVNAKPVKYSALYGAIAVILFIAMFIFIFWYAGKYYDVHPFNP